MGQQQQQQWMGQQQQQQQQQQQHQHQQQQQQANGTGTPPNTGSTAPPTSATADQGHQQEGSPDPTSSSGGPARPLSTSKRAEQNRKAQRAFRERRDQHVKALESRSTLLDAALASADEANRRWEECRALVDQLRIENAALRGALAQAQAAAAAASGGPSKDGGGEEKLPSPDGEAQEA